MFKYVYRTTNYLFFCFLPLITFYVTLTYAQPHLVSQDKLSLDYINVEYFYFLNTVYLSIVTCLVIIMLLNRQILLTSLKPLIIFITFTGVIFFLVYTNSIFIFFVMYEILLILTAAVVYFNSQNVRSKSITFYFIFWTQLSSFILWLAVMYIYYNTGSYLFTQLHLYFCDDSTKTLIKYMLLLSFSIKLPLWPFSFWLIKTHVEANTSFSIFLSGVLVKTALIGLIKFNIFFINTDCTLIFTLIVLSVIFTTFAINVQVDFKKLIAYTTVQEMSLVVFFTLFNSYNNLNVLIYFILLHTFMSVVMFLLNDSVYVRFKTRKTKLCLGIATVTPKLNFILISSWVLFISIPLSFKFIFEVILLWKFFSFPYLILITLLLCLQFLTLIFFTMNVIPYSFGNGSKTTQDLTKNEYIVYAILVLLLLTLIF